MPRDSTFTGRLRYSGASLGYQLASVIAGGPAPLIATWLLVQFNSAYAVAVYILVCAVLTLIATAMMKDYTGKDIGGSTNKEWLFPTLITSSVLMPEERRARGHDLRIWRNRHEPGKVRLFAAAPSKLVRHLQADE